MSRACVSRGQGHRPISLRLFSSTNTSRTSCPGLRSPRSLNWISSAVLSRRTTMLGASHARKASPIVTATPKPMPSGIPTPGVLNRENFTSWYSPFKACECRAAYWVPLCLVTSEGQDNLQSQHPLVSASITSQKNCGPCPPEPRAAETILIEEERYFSKLNAPLMTAG